MNSDAYRRFLVVDDELHALVREGKRDPEIVRKRIQEIIDEREAVRPAIPGADIKIGIEECNRFLRDVFGLAVDCGTFPQAVMPTDRAYWASADHSSLTYPRIVEAALAAKLPLLWHIEHTSIDVQFDARQPGERVLWTPAGIEVTAACPELVGVPCRSLWQQKEQVVTGREQILLALLVRHATKGEVLLDLVGWTRTGSRSVHGHGVRVHASDGRVNVYWTYPDNDNRDGSSRSVVLA